jgi:hypothetical protein
MSLSLSLNQHLKGGTEAGLGIALELGPLQIFGIIDHVPLRYAKVDITDDKREEFLSLNIFPTRVNNITFIDSLHMLLHVFGWQLRPS